MLTRREALALMGCAGTLNSDVFAAESRTSDAPLLIARQGVFSSG